VPPSGQLERASEPIVDPATGAHAHARAPSSPARLRDLPSLDSRRGALKVPPSLPGRNSTSRTGARSATGCREERTEGARVSAAALEPYAIAAGLCALNLVWLFLSAVGLPGNWLMVVTTAAVAVWQWDSRMIGPWALAALFALALAGEAMEALSGAVATRRVGGSRKAALGAIAGGLLGGLFGTGLIPVPVLGTLIGVGAGAFVGATALEIIGGAPVDRSVRSGAGAAVGQSLGVLAKIAMGAAIWITAAVAAFWP
jgi:uncharacterized protein